MISRGGNVLLQYRAKSAKFAEGTPTLVKPRPFRSFLERIDYPYQCQGESVFTPRACARGLSVVFWHENRQISSFFCRIVRIHCAYE